MANEDRAYQAWLRTRPCSRCGKSPPSIVHHHTQRRGKGQRAHDHDGMPLCTPCHVGLHGSCGTFKHWPRAQLRQWQDEQCTHHRAQYRPNEEPECETTEEPF